MFSWNCQSNNVHIFKMISSGCKTANFLLCECLAASVDILTIT